MLVQRVLILLWKYLLVKEEELFYWWKVSKFLLAALFANARRVDVSTFRVKNTAIFETPTTKTNILTFLENERLYARTTYIRLLIYLKAIYGPKNEGNRFFNSCYSMVDISWLSLLIFAIFRRSCSRNTLVKQHAEMSLFVKHVAEKQHFPVFLWRYGRHCHA